MKQQEQLKANGTGMQKELLSADTNGARLVRISNESSIQAKTIAKAEGADLFICETAAPSLIFIDDKVSKDPYGYVKVKNF